MSQFRNQGLCLAICALAIAGCSSPKEPFLDKFQRPLEQCLSASEFAHMNADAAISNNAAFRDGHPMRYVVRKGDTLWAIAGRFLRKPWYWRQIWRANPQIKNPNLIYPGDVLKVVVIRGQKYLEISESGSPYHGNYTGRYTRHGLPIVRYTPNMTQDDLPTSPSKINASILRPFIARTRIVGVDEAAHLPFIFGDGGNYLTLSEQQFIYAQGNQGERGTQLWVYRKGKPVIDYDRDNRLTDSKLEPEKAVIIGQQMDYVGEVTVLSYDPLSGLTKLQPTSVVRTMQEGDVLLPADDALPPVDYFPQLPSKQCQRGYILNNTNDESLRITEFSSVVTSFGRDNGARVGDIWKIERPGKLRMIQGKPIAVPGNTVGYLMIYKVYDNVSLGLVLDSSQPIDKTDYLVHP